MFLMQTPHTYHLFNPPFYIVSGATFDEFVDDLLEAEVARECRYAVYDAEFKLPDGQNRSKLVFFLW